ncbi:hypothetical protein [Lysinibacillus pakistanensis]|uniref:DUF4375 domain-containing protein n=1 Tax=Lysinibacillus pakistanensis TaxID=759811 RepID=A0ABX6DA05_9BACI|nr:hypothetical protein GDS87_11755 [Lysinibacillus pakistanensis]
MVKKMSIPGVREVESSSIKKIRANLDPSFTKGHDFCELMIDETANRFTAVLYGGESYTFCWGSPGDSFVKFLIKVFNNDDYLYEKLADCSKEKFVDTEKTGNHLKERLLKARRFHEIDENDARDMWDNIESLQNESEIMNDHLYGLWNTWFSAMIKNDIISDEPWFEDFIEYQKDWKCLIFCEKVAPILAEIIKQEYQIAA